MVIIFNSINQIYTFHTFCPSFLFFLYVLQLDLLATTTTSKVVMDLGLPPGQTPLGQKKDALARADCAPDCGQNWTVHFAKPDNPIYLVLSRIFPPLFVSFAN
jgi:hypothetical protein